MKFLASAALAAIAAADKSKFPKDDSFHADCHVNANINGFSCDNLYALIDNEIRSWGSSTTSPAGGVYQMYEEQNDVYIWSKRLTRDEKYTDDQLFEFTDTPNGCAIAGHSRSESMSVYDYSVNFCNLWNVYENLPLHYTYSVG